MHMIFAFVVEVQCAAMINDNDDIHDVSFSFTVINISLRIKNRINTQHM